MTTTEKIYEPDGSFTTRRTGSDVVRSAIKARNDLISRGVKPHPNEEVLAAIADGRAGGEGIARLWRP